jgi:hypothetical protein
MRLATYQYGTLVGHAYWIGAIPATLFLALVMMPFYYICKTHSVPGYLKLRYGEGARSLSAISFAVMTILMSGINDGQPRGVPALSFSSLQERWEKCAANTACSTFFTRMVRRRI